MMMISSPRCQADRDVLKRISIFSETQRLVLNRNFLQSGKSSARRCSPSTRKNSQFRNTAERIEVVVWNNHSDEFGTLDWFDEEHLNQKIVQYIESAGCFTQILIEFHCIPMENMDVLEELSKFTRNVLICFEF